MRRGTPFQTNITCLHNTKEITLLTFLPPLTLRLSFPLDRSALPPSSLYWSTSLRSLFLVFLFGSWKCKNCLYLSVLPSSILPVLYSSLSFQLNYVFLPFLSFYSCPSLLLYHPFPSHPSLPPFLHSRPSFLPPHSSPFSLILLLTQFVPFTSFDSLVSSRKCKNCLSAGPSHRSRTCPSALLFFVNLHFPPIFQGLGSGGLSHTRQYCGQPLFFTPGLLTWVICLEVCG